MFAVRDAAAVAQVAHLAIEWRQRFQKDVLVDLYGYRRYGHNEGDEPRFTQPQMYRIIDKKSTVREMYVKRLVELGQIDATVADDIGVRRRQALSEALDEVKKKGFVPAPDTMGGVWQGYAGGADASAPEAVTASLFEALCMDWRPHAAKSVVIMADAGPHGLGLGHSFPEGDPDGKVLVFGFF